MLKKILVAERELRSIELQNTKQRDIVKTNLIKFVEETMGRVKELATGQGIDAFYLPDNYEYWEGYQELPTPHSCTHSFPNTGMRKSWCSKCGIEAEWSAEKGEYLLRI